MLAGCHPSESAPSPSPATQAFPQDVLYRDDFTTLQNWVPELEKPGRIQATNHTLDIDVPAGATLWLKQSFRGPLEITYNVRAIQQGGPNDRVSDLNCFWMARDSRSPDDLFASPRSGKFADYDLLRCYYVGFGGNANTTTRFRRYIGVKDNRPLLAQHDLRGRDDLIEPNRTYRIRLVAAGRRIEYWRDDRCLFQLDDAEPYTSGHFALRTVANHLTVSDLVIRRLPDLPSYQSAAENWNGGR
jgi:hypothetical protein